MAWPGSRDETDAKTETPAMSTQGESETRQCLVELRDETALANSEPTTTA